MTELIAKIKAGENIEVEIQSVINDLHRNGPVDYGALELLSYAKLYQPETFDKYQKTILNLMGLYFKQNIVVEDDIRGLISGIYGRSIAGQYGGNYTPVQANLIENMTDNRLFSFSSATSTGKSHVFRDLILKQTGDMVIVVPSRALINEYFIRTLDIVKDRMVNVLVFPDIVNTDMSEKNVFILTPERVKDLFRIKTKLNLRTVLFDEAQIADDDNRRGIYFDSIVRRIDENFPGIKMLFAQPYIDNPEAQFLRNNLTLDSGSSNSRAYPYRNVGQIFTCLDNNGDYYHFAIDKYRLGSRKVLLDYDPIKKCLAGNGSVLVYVSKASIYDGEALSGMAAYTDDLSQVDDHEALKIIEKIGELLGGSADERNPEHSNLLSLLNKGIVIHHGSLPLQARFLLEKFISNGYCRICFATSTLYQGINMPFDVVYLKRFEASRPLLVKNLIGRAGRSTDKPIFDFGQVVLGYSNMSKIREVLARHDTMSTLSQIDVDTDEDDEDTAEFKEAIRQGQLNDNYNLTNIQVKRLSAASVADSVESLLDVLLADNTTIDKVYRNLDVNLKTHVTNCFIDIYRRHVNNRQLSDGEIAVIENAIHIFMDQISGRNLKSIIGARFAYIAKTRERRQLRGHPSYSKMIEIMRPNFTMPAHDIPDKNLQRYGLFQQGTRMYQVGYDRVMYDTYDYIDKVWGFCLSDVFYAAFDIFYQRTFDIRAEIMCKYIRYATIDSIEIWLLRYGFSFEEIEWMKPHVESVDERRIIFKDISLLSEDQLDVIRRYLPNDSMAGEF